MKKIHVNIDIGEGFNNEEFLLPYISACNIACGGHAGDVATISKIIRLAIKNKVAIGAHPSYPDKANFGRVVLQISESDLHKSITEQLELFKSVCQQKQATISHVKAHGALYNIATKDASISAILIDAIQTVIGKTTIYAPYNSQLEKVALRNKCEVKYEVFCDRNYNDDLSLVSRNHPKAIIANPDEMVAHVQNLINGKVKTNTGNYQSIKAETFCLHGDHAETKDLLRHLTQHFAIEKLPTKH